MSMPSLVTCHSEKESAAATFKGGFGYHPLLAFLDNTGEALAGLLRPGTPGSNTAADHITVTELALAQIPETDRYDRPILIRADGAGATRDWLGHLHGLRETSGLDLEFSVGFTMTKAVQAAIDALPRRPGRRRSRPTVSQRRRRCRGDHRPAGRPDRGGLASRGCGSSCVANDPIPAPNYRCSINTTGCATRRSPPTHPTASSPTSKPDTAPMPASKTGSAAAKTPASAGSPPDCSRSTPPGWNSP